MRELHVDTDLSAYLDGELPPAERARVEAHLASCDRCARRLADLRSTAALIAGLPYSRASRSLVPRVTERWRWLRPVRSLSAVASGAFLFVFLITAVAQSAGGLGNGATTASAPAAAPLAATAAADAAKRSDQGVPAAAPQPTAAATALPAPAFGAADRSQRSAPSAPSAPSAFAQNASQTPCGSPEPPCRGVAPIAPAPVTPLRSPLFWLALAIVAAMLAIVAHVRLRAS